MNNYSKLNDALKNKSDTDILIAHDIPNSKCKTYYLLESYNHLKKICLSPSKNTHYYEIIPEHETVNLFLDVESITDEPDITLIIETIIQNFISIYGIFDIKYFILNSSTSTKYSYHIIFRIFKDNKPFYFKDITELKKFIHMNIEDYKKLFIDTNVYNKNRCFRMIYNSKYEKNIKLECIGYDVCGNILVNDSNVLDTLVVYKSRDKNNVNILPEIDISSNINNQLVSFKKINDLFNLQNSTQWSLESDHNNYKVVPDCYTCILTRKEHSDRKHSCLFINTDNKTIVKSCFSCTPSSTINDVKESKKILQVVNVVFNLNINFNLEDSLFNKLRKRLESFTEQHNFKRELYTGMVYCQVKPYAYTFYKEPIPFLNECFFDDEDFKSHQNNVDNLIKFIKQVDSTSFPFITLDKNYIGFSNGLFNLTTCHFLENYSNSDIVCNKYIDKPFTFSMDTPNLDIIIDYQFTPDVKKFIYTCLGRMFGIRDNFGFMLYLLGEAGCGKSVLIEVLAECFNHVGSINESFEKKYGLSYLYNKDIVVCDDLPKNIHEILPQQTFQSMITNGRVATAVKNKDAIDSIWKVPLLFAGNWFPSYIDKGQISRRLLVANFEKNVYTQDTSLKQKILDNELPNFIYKCTKYYNELLLSSANKSIWDICPDYFKDQQEELRIERNPLYKYLLENTCYEEGSQIPLNEIKANFEMWLEKKVSKLDHGTFGQVNKQYIIIKLKICKSCRNKHIKGCCDKYGRTNQSLGMFVNNVKLI